MLNTEKTQKSIYACDHRPPAVPKAVCVRVSCSFNDKEVILLSESEDMPRFQDLLRFLQGELEERGKLPYNKKVRASMDEEYREETSSTTIVKLKGTVNGQFLKITNNEWQLPDRAMYLSYEEVIVLLIYAGLLQKPLNIWEIIFSRIQFFFKR